MTIKQAQKLAKEKLSPKRYRHTQNVAAAARQLAQRYGAGPHAATLADEAELAGWLHDIVKELPREDLLQLLGMDAIMAKSTSARPQPVWHGPAAAVYASHSLGVTDAAVLSAIACHTTGKAGMSTLDKVLFLADMISAERDYDGVQHIRALAETDLDAAVIAAMEQSVAWLQKTGKPLDTETLEALAWMKQPGPTE